MDNTALLSLPLLANKQALQTTFHDEALKTLDALVMLSAIDRDLSSPPSTPDEGDRYIVMAPGSGDDAWQDDHLVMYVDGGWRGFAPQPGWVCYLQDEATLIAWDGTAWQPAIGGGALGNLTMLGVGTAADAANPVSARLNNVLLAAKPVADGGDGDLRAKLSKESASNIASFLFQDNFSGRAEIGLTGDDDFHFKVSPDGSTWHDGIVIDKDSGAVAFPNSPIAVAQRGNVLAPHENLVCKYTGSATLSVTADAVLLFDAGGHARRFVSLSETLDIAASGANGLDTGSEGASRWYHIWAIGKADGTLDALLSESATAPTLPGGYVYAGYLGAVYNNGSSNFVPFFQRGNVVVRETFNALTNGTQTTFTSIDLSTAVPPTATEAMLGILTLTSSGTADVSTNVAPAGTGTTPTYGFVRVSNPAQSTTAMFHALVGVLMETAQTVHYFVQGTNAQTTIQVRGFKF
jgi:hypothetical protein